MPNVFIVGKDYSIERMFVNQGWNIVRDIDKAEYVQFTGGADVSPMLYGEPRHPRTGTSPSRDEQEADIYYSYMANKKMLGICRGGQFLNVMNGGAMHQHVNNHAMHGTHVAKVVSTGELFQVTSTHHQMMIPHRIGKVLVTANLSTSKENGWEEEMIMDYPDDIESVFYEDTMSLCFQPHPEYVDADHDCQKLYFSLIKQYLMN